MLKMFIMKQIYFCDFSAIDLVDDSMVLDKMAKYQRKDLTMLFSKSQNLICCGLFFHLFLLYFSYSAPI